MASSNPILSEAETHQTVAETEPDVQKLFDLAKSGGDIRILSLSGGGVRGIIEIQIMMEIERRTGKRIHELFDAIYGTSTGSILAVGVGRLKMTLEEAKESYFELSKKIFPRSFFGKCYSRLWCIVFGWKYSHTELENCLQRKFGDETTLIPPQDEASQYPLVGVVTAERTTVPPQVHVFRSFKYNNSNDTSKKVKCWQAVKASCSAPTYFPHVKIEDRIFVDGGVLANNPCEVAYDEIVGKADAFYHGRQVDYVVSLGTGLEIPANGNVGPIWGWIPLRWITEIASYADLLTSTKEVVSRMEKKLPDEKFFHFDPTVEKIGLDDADQLDNLIKWTKDYLEEEVVREFMDKLAKQITAKTWVLVLDQMTLKTSRLLIVSRLPRNDTTADQNSSQDCSSKFVVKTDNQKESFTVEAGSNPYYWLIRPSVLYEDQSNLTVNYDGLSISKGTAFELDGAIKSSLACNYQLQLEQNCLRQAFNATTVPDFTDEFYPRNEERDRICRLIKAMSDDPSNGFVAVYGERGVGKSTLISALLRDEHNSKNGNKLVGEGKTYVAIWLNCYQWRREVFPEGQSFETNQEAQEAFVYALTEQAKRAALALGLTLAFNEVASESTEIQLAFIVTYFDRNGGRRVLFVLDDVFNNEMVIYLRNYCRDAICCLITRESDPIRSIVRQDRLYELKLMLDKNIKEMLSGTLGLQLTEGGIDERLSEEEIDELVGKCCQLPLIAYLIAAHFKNMTQHGNTTSRQRYETAFRKLKKKPIGLLPTELIPDRQKETVHQLFESSIKRMKMVEQIRYYAFLIFNPVEQISIDYMAVLWNTEQVEEADDSCKKFKDLSLLRPLKTENTKVCYVVHQLLYEATVANLKKELTKNARMIKHFDGGAWLAALRYLDGAMLDGRSDFAKKCLPVLYRCLGDSTTQHLIKKIARRLPANRAVDLFTAKLPQQSKPFLLKLAEYDEEIAETCFLELVKCDKTKLVHMLKAIGGVCGIYNLLSRYSLGYLYKDELFSTLKEVQSTGKYVKRGPGKPQQKKGHGTRNKKTPKKPKGTGELKAYEEELLKLDPLFAAIITGSEDELRQQIKANDRNQEEFRLKFKGAVFIAIAYANFKALGALYEVIGDEEWQLISTRKYEGRTPIILAIYRERLDIVEFLYQKCPQAIKLTNCIGALPLWCAITTNNLELVKFIHELDRDAISDKDRFGATPLQQACESSSFEVVKFLYTEYQEAIEQVDKNGDTPLHKAVINERIEVANFIYSKYPGAIGFSNKNGVKPLLIACENGSPEGVEFLYKEYLAAMKMAELPKCEIETLIKRANGSTFHKIKITSFLQQHLDSVPNTDK